MPELFLKSEINLSRIYSTTKTKTKALEELHYTGMIAHRLDHLVAKGPTYNSRPTRQRIEAPKVSRVKTPNASKGWNYPPTHPK